VRIRDGTCERRGLGVLWLGSAGRCVPSGLSVVPLVVSSTVSVSGEREVLVGQGVVDERVGPGMIGLDGERVDSIGLSHVSRMGWLPGWGWVLGSRVRRPEL
jgi:hypothetical protein